jgi:hypothetical protein
MKTDVAVIILTYKRVDFFNETCKMISGQTSKSFDLFILDASNQHNRILDALDKILKPSGITYRILDQSSDRDTSAWRRHVFAGRLAQKGYKKIIFIDDDIIIPNNFIELALEQYEDKSLKSWWAFKINDPQNYIETRTRVLDRNAPVNYCAPCAAILDSSIFLDKGYFNLPSPEFIWVEDLWISFYAQQIIKWKLGYLDIDGIKFEEHFSEQFALWHAVQGLKTTTRNKDDFVKLLTNEFGWTVD